MVFKRFSLPGYSLETAAPYVNSAVRLCVSSVIVMVPYTFSNLVDDNKFVMLILGSFTVMFVPSGKLNFIRPTRLPRIELGPDNLI